MKKFYFYILRCKDSTLYCGSTNNTKNRIKRHNAGHGSIYVRAHGGGEMVYFESYPTLAEAMRREVEVKKWTRQKKENLIKAFKL
ncbi:MAG: hypothetical protein A2826_02010 [Candidatus Doudnabacteria bacterium RIFCSPHIGHO2_01_FULL_43_23]|uniref:GIY-YIG domain-containing protein n=1 Tax=Candidatus Doudnabacteria bacterium RIFCSPHIGHO2_01_FULL_43_23 TaxID=1817822 RepID=A0A1F5NUV8_9BACT|nr:MAG: hypothetical protein A2826_02010 [Candidatus Doudnabacteria bacterium RIFCSPHIGHO2_01_FULL_43_23]